MMKAMFVNQLSHQGVKYADAIADGIKPVETRSRNMLQALVGERVAIVRTMRGKAPTVLGYVTVCSATFKPWECMDANRDLTLILGSYFEVPFGENVFDAAVSVESLHHFTKEEKIPLYRKLHAALKAGGYFILTDYFALCEETEEACRAELIRLRKEQGIPDGVFCHYDTPLTVEHETQALLEGGFSGVEILKHWGPTAALKAVK